MKWGKFRYPALVAGVVLAFAATAGLSIYRDHEDTLARIHVQARDMERIVEDHVRRTLARADGVLKEVVDAARAEDGVHAFGDARHVAWLDALGERIGVWSNVVVVDANGQSVAESRQHPVSKANVADRPYFVAIKNGAPFHIGPAVVGRSAGKIVFTVARPLLDRGGKFAGVAIAAIDADSQTSFFELFDFQLSPVVGVFREDGGIVARYPDMRNQVGRNVRGGPLFEVELKKAPAGSFHSISPLDKVRRLSFYRTMEDYRLIIVAGVVEDVAMAPWRTRARDTIGLTLAATMLLLAALHWANRASWRERRAERALVKAIAAHGEVVAQLDHARLDTLTGLPSRSLFMELALPPFRRAREGDQGLAVLFVDLDGFKQINDTHGHEYGDEVLRRSAQLFLSVLRSGDVAGRMGGDEFVIAVTGPADKIGAIACSIADRLVNRISEVDKTLGCSVGIVAGVRRHADLDAMIRAADAAMYRAKRAGKGRYVLDAGAPQVAAVA